MRADLEATLKDLQLDYVDSFVIHWPQAAPACNQLAVAKDGAFPAPKAEKSMFPCEDDGTFSFDAECHFVETWQAMEKLVDAGLAKTIGLSNFNRRQIRENSRNRPHQADGAPKRISSLSSGFFSSLFSLQSLFFNFFFLLKNK